MIFLCQYEKKRYYVDPAQANLSGIKQQLTGGSTGSADSHGSHKLQSSSLIGESEKPLATSTSCEVKLPKLFVKPPMVSSKLSLKLLDLLEPCRTLYRALKNLSPPINLYASMFSGSTLRSRVDPSSVMGGHNSGVSSFVSRPEHVSGHVAPVSVGRPEAPASSNNGLFSAPVTVTQAPAAPAAQAGDSFANFANFDAVAFESLPAGN